MEQKENLTDTVLTFGQAIGFSVALNMLAGIFRGVKG